MTLNFVNISVKSFCLAVFLFYSHKLSLLRLYWQQSDSTELCTINANMCGSEGSFFNCQFGPKGLIHIFIFCSAISAPLSAKRRPPKLVLPDVLPCFGLPRFVAKSCVIFLLSVVGTMALQKYLGVKATS